MDRKVIIIPTYNEKENIEKIIRAIFALPGEYHILVIEDGSPDGTGQIVKGLQDEFPERLFMIERSGKLGLGTAYITGFKWSVEHGYDYIFEMDADFSHTPDDVPRLYEACAKDGADLAIGSRYCNGISVINWPIGRVIMSYYASVYVRKVLGMNVFDTTAGFKCYKRKVLETIDFQIGIQDKGSPDNIRGQERGDVENEQRNLRGGVLGRVENEIQKNQTQRRQIKSSGDCRHGISTV